MKVNVKELLLIVTTALLITWGVEYLVWGRHRKTDSGIQSGQSFTAPAEKRELKPLNTEVDFIDQRRKKPAVQTHVETPYARFWFTTDGASLERLEFKKEAMGWSENIITVFPVTDTERDHRCFLVGLDEETPYYYDLLSNSETDDAIELLYRATVPAGTVTKMFRIDKHDYKIEVKLTAQPHSENTPMALRIFYPAPTMPDLADRDVKSAIVGDHSDTIKIIDRSKLQEDTGWFSPTLFGTTNKYFVQSMVRDGDNFAQRAYYSLTGHSGIISILEGPTVTTEQSWTIPFYFGPKEEKAMVAVDQRLSQLSGYAGLLAPISRLLLKLLNFFYRYFGNYGWAIIVLTVLIRLILIPFSFKTAESAKKNKELQRKLKYLEQKYKGNPELLAQEKAALIRKEGLPGLGGCLPLFLQLPIFFALSRVLSTSIQLYKAPFIGWMTDLSAPDPYYVLPMLLAVGMLLQAFTMDKAQRMQFLVFAVLIGVVSAKFSIGIALYIAVSTLLGVAQTLIQQKMKLA